MTLTEAADKYGIFGLLIVMVIQSLVIPVAKLMLPAAQKAKIAAEKEARALDERRIVAIEKSANAMLITTERMEVFGRGQDSILKTQNSVIEMMYNQSKILAVLLDRREQTQPPATNRRRTKSKEI
jgi:hypothetical protein